MFGKRITLFRLFGFEVRIDLSWIVIAVLVTWALGTGLFPHYYRGLSTYTYWLMGAAAAIGLFISIVFHEMFHSLVARKFDLQMGGITLFIFGGVAEMTEEPRDPKVEFYMAIAGPLSSLFLGGALYGIGYSLNRAGTPVTVTAVIAYLAFINVVLAGFNLIPAFPLDGGRVLRSALWKWKKDLTWATRISAQIGSSFGFLFIAVGIFSVLTGRLFSGIWWFFIGMFLRSVSQSSYQQILTRKALEGEKVRNLMRPDPVTVPPDVHITSLVEDYIYKYHFKMFPVANDGKLFGCISPRDIKHIPREEWGRRTVREAVRECSNQTTIRPEVDVTDAMSLMNSTGNSRLLVIEGEDLLGIITLKDIMGYMTAKLDLERGK